MLLSQVPRESEFQLLHSFPARERQWGSWQLQQPRTPNANLLSALAVVGLPAQGEGCSLLGEAARAVFPSHTPCLHLISPLSLQSTFHLLPAPVLWAGSGAKGMLSSFFLKKPLKPNSLQSNRCMSVSDTKETWGFMLVAAPRGIRGWISSSRKAGSHRNCQHGCCCSPGEPPPEQHSSAGMHRYSAKSKGCFPSQSGA